MLVNDPADTPPSVLVSIVSVSEIAYFLLDFDELTGIATLSSFIQPVIGSELNSSQTLHEIIS
jgi:hypothetical protein